VFWLKENVRNFFTCYDAILHGRTGRKKLGGRKEICPTFSDSARPVPKNFFPEQINFEDHPPPSPKKFWSVYHLRGQKNFSDIPIFFETSLKFSIYHKISHKIYTISHILDRILPIFFYNKPILPDCGANIA
jgi:hypothetical protein